MMNNLLCPTLLPVQCDITIAPALFGSNWTIACGQWVNANIVMTGDRLDIRKVLFGLCQIVNDSNTNYYAQNGNRDLQSSNTVISSSSDPTLNDSSAVYTTNDTDASSNAIVIDGSTATTSNGYSDNEYNSMDANSQANINANANGNFNGNASGSKLFVVGMLSSLIAFILL